MAQAERAEKESKEKRKNGKKNVRKRKISNGRWSWYGTYIIDEGEGGQSGTSFLCRSVSPPYKHPLPPPALFSLPSPEIKATYSSIPFSPFLPVSPESAVLYKTLPTNLLAPKRHYSTDKRKFFFKTKNKK